METEFVAWVQAELNKRGWTPAELVRRGGLSDSQMSRVMNGTRGPGIDFLRGIATAFQIPLDTVFRRAGWLPDHGDVLPQAREWSARLCAISDLEQREATIQAMDNVLRVAEGAPARARRSR
jgi:transcriptional regulator with XRE-family HTH domain